MNMRWAWIFPVLSSLAVTLVPVASQGQGDKKSSAKDAAGQPANPASQAALAQAAQAQAQQAAYGEASMIPVIAPPPGTVPSGVRPIGYIAAPMPGAVPGLLPGAAGGAYPAPMMSAGMMPPGMMPSPNAFGSYGAMP